MIIRLTVKDNDFSNMMNIFVKNLSNKITKIPSNIRDLDAEKQFEILRELNYAERLLNPNVTENHTEEEKEILIKRIKEAFSEFVNNGAKDYAEYLINNFEVKIVSSMEDK